jgi:hypothetical protein
MIMRLIHLTVVAALIVAAVYVYKVKFESTMRATELARLAAAIKRERDVTAALKAEWAQLENPARIQELTERHLSLRMLDPAQLDSFDHLPVRPAPPGPQPDAIAAMIGAWEAEQPDNALPAAPPHQPSPQIGEGGVGGATHAPR